MQTMVWEVIARLGAWRNPLYIMAPSEWEAGKTAEITLHQLDIDAEVIEVISRPDLDLKPLLQVSETPERSCMICSQSLDYGQLLIEREILVETKPFSFCGIAVKRVGEIRKVICPSCGCPETWKRYFGYIPVNWFDELEGRIIPFVGKTLRNHKEVINS